MNCHLCNNPLTDPTRRFMGMGEVHVSCFDRWRALPPKENGMGRAVTKDLNDIKGEPEPIKLPDTSEAPINPYAGFAEPDKGTPPDQSNAGGKPAAPAKARQDAELRILRRMLQLLDELPSEAAKRRTVAWLSDRYDDNHPFDA